jgi:hypothetical protein
MSRITIQGIESITFQDQDTDIAIVSGQRFSVPDDTFTNGLFEPGNLCVIVPWDKLHLVRKGSLGYGEADAIDQEPRDVMFPFVPDTVSENRNPSVSIWYCPALDVKIKTTELWDIPDLTEQQQLALIQEQRSFTQSIIDVTPERLSWLTGSPESFVGLDITKSVELINKLNDIVDTPTFDEENRDGE